jgi:hypothetical protein
VLPKKKDWKRISAFFTFLSVVVALSIGVISLTATDEALRYFGITCVLFFAFFVYFEVFKEYPTSRSK